MSQTKQPPGKTVRFRTWPARHGSRTGGPAPRAEAAQLSFEDRLALLVDREVLARDNKRLKARLRFAGLRQSAAPEDVDYRAHRGLDRALFQRLAQGEWIERQ